MSSSALLLRLFTSDFFNSWIAVSYLFKYRHSVGIQHYLCEELKKFPDDEIEFFLPQLVHLLVSSSTDSLVLEEFLLYRCERSMHLAILTLWYLQSYQSDFANVPNGWPAKICERALRRCNDVLFGDYGGGNDSDENDTGAGYGYAAPGGGFSWQRRRRREEDTRIRENIAPSLVGIGCILASVSGPTLTRGVAQLALTEGRRQQITSAHNLSSPDNLGVVAGPVDGQGAPEGMSLISSQRSRSSQRSTSPPTSPSLARVPRSSSASSLSRLTSNLPTQAHSLPASPSLEDLRRGKAFAFNDLPSRPQRTRGPHHTADGSIHGGQRSGLSLVSPVLVSTSNSLPTSPVFASLSEKELDLMDIYESPSSPPRSAPSTPMRSSLRHQHPIPSRLAADAVQDTLHYVHSELAFISSLVDISNRLCQVPKPARQSTLMAELELLNHNLPADVCLPRWCYSNQARDSANSERSGERHQQVVRINPNDAVVLNSADRVPYLLLVEVLEAAPRSEWIDDDDDADDHETSDARANHPPTPSFKPEIPSIALTFVDPEGTGDLADEMNRYPPGNSLLHSPRSIGSTSPVRPPSANQHRTNAGSESTGRASSGSHLLSEDRTSSESHVSPSASSVSSSERAPQHSVIPEAEYAERMRTAAVMLAQLAAATTQQQGLPTSPILSPGGPGSGVTMPRSASKASVGAAETIRARIIQEMQALEESRLATLMRGGRADGGPDGGPDGASGSVPGVLVKNKDDPSAAVFREDWKAKRARIRASSPYGNFANWRLLSVIVKTGADLRQEQFACQLIREMQRIWFEAKVPVWVKYMRILVTSANSGLMETIKNTISIHSLKKDAYARHLKTSAGAEHQVYTLSDHFINLCNPSDRCSNLARLTAKAFERRRTILPDLWRDTRWFATYCRSKIGNPRIPLRSVCELACRASWQILWARRIFTLSYFTRHNGNILIDTEGHVIHIDFGFMLSNSPGSVGFEMAPFKLPGEYVDVLGGMESPQFKLFKELFIQGFFAMRKHADNILLLVDMMQSDSKLACFAHANTTQALKDRFQLTLTEPQAAEFAETLIMKSCYNVFTRLYDVFQYQTNGIL